VLLMADEAGRGGLMHTRSRGGAPHPLRPVVARHMGRASLAVFAAVCPPVGHRSAVLVPEAKSPRMTRFLAPGAAALAASGSVRLVDRAGGPLRHHVTVPANRR